MKQNYKFKNFGILIKASDDVYDAEPRVFDKDLTVKDIKTLAKKAQPQVELGDYYTELTHGAPLYLYILFSDENGDEIFDLEIHDIPCPCDMRSQLENLQKILEDSIESDEVNFEKLKKLVKIKKFLSAGDFDMVLWNEFKSTGKVSNKLTPEQAEKEMLNVMNKLVAENAAMEDSDECKVSGAVFGFWDWIKQNQKIVKLVLAKDKTKKK